MTFETLPNGKEGNYKINDHATPVYPSLEERVMRKPTPMPLHCCAGMTLDEWAESMIGAKNDTRCIFCRMD